MLLVVPVSNADKKLIPFFAKGFENFHPGNGHKLLVVGNPSISEVIRSVEATLSKYFAETKTFTTSVDNVNGWPMAMNHLFHETSRHIIANYGPEDAFLWMELDSTPLKENWLSTLATTYFADSNVAHSEGREFNRYMGAEVVTRESRNGEILPTSETGTHMAAVGVYPSDVAARIKMLNVTPNVQKAFYEYVQWPIVNNLQRTNLIQHNWMTRNYRREGNKIVSDSANRLAYGVDYNSPVSPEAVLLHGVKDGTLQALLGGSSLPEILPPALQPLPEEAFTPSTPENEMVEVLTRDPSTGRITGEYISRKELQAREAEELRIAEMRAKHLNPVVNLPEIAPEPVQVKVEDQKYDYFPEGKGTTPQPYDPLPEKSQDELHGVDENTVTIQDILLVDHSNTPKVGFDTEFIRRENEKKAKEEEVLLNNNPQPARKKGKRGPGRPKKIKRQITPEDREARAQRMRDVAKNRWANKQAAEEVNG